MDESQVLEDHHLNPESNNMGAGGDYSDLRGSVDGGGGFGEVSQAEYQSIDLWPEYADPSYRMPEQIEVKVSLASGDYFFPVRVVKAQSKKPYLGGFRNKMSGAVYHHGNSQTPTEVRKVLRDTQKYSTRDTQTYETRTLSLQTRRECGTQMDRPDHILDNKLDKLISPKPYVTADELLITKKIKTVILQRYWRGYKARCRANDIRRRNKEYHQKIIEDDESMRVQLCTIRDMDMQRRLHPSSNADFEILYNELDTWRNSEVAKIKATTSANSEERRLAMAALLANETKSLQSIQRLKMQAHKDMHEEKTSKMLDLMSKPHRWQLSNGETAFVHTPATKRAQELLDLHQALNNYMTTLDERFNILLQIKWTVQEFDNSLSRDIVDLIDRESDLLSRGRSVKSVEKLRIRLANLFLMFIENPLYNPRAKDFIGVSESKI
jgi:hypothetical protein